MEKVSKKYDIIYADPPWEYRVWGKKNRQHGCQPLQHAVFGYLACMDIASLSNADSALFMWATFPV